MGPSDLKLPPQDLDAERSVLGGMLLSATACDEVMLKLRTEMFYATPNQLMFEAISEMHDAGKHAIDALTVGHELERRGKLDEVGGAPYIGQVLAAVPHAAHSGYYADIVREKWLRREIGKECGELLRESYNLGCTADELAARTEQQLHRLIETGTPSQSISVTDALASVFDDRNQERRVGLKTGYESFDRIIDGMMPGTVTVLAARPSMGKTAFCLNVLRNVCTAGFPALFVSLEQPSMELAERLLAMESSVAIHAMRKGLLEEADQWALSEAANRLSPLPLRFEDRSYLTPQKIAAIARLDRRRRGIRLLAIDYLQLIEPDDVKLHREQQVAQCCRQLKSLAKDLQIPILLLAQLNRNVESRDDKSPRLADLRESGSIEQDADQVWFLWRPEVYTAGREEGVARLRVAKNRNGPLGEVKFAFRASYFRFDVLADYEESFASDEPKYEWQ